MGKKFQLRKFNKICKDIQSVKIQGARNIAKAGLNAYELNPTPSAKKKLLSLRPTEPMLRKVLSLTETLSKHEILNHFKEAQNSINLSVVKLIKSDSVIFTHCHSTNVISALTYAKSVGKKFHVYNTETRPLFQGRKTAKELTLARIPVTMFTDSAVSVALSKETGKKPDKVFLGADALTKKGIINKIGSETIAKIAKQEKIPVYIIADSWKFTTNPVPIESRSLNEVWNKAPKNVKINNPAFEFVPKNLIPKIVTEYGILTYSKFLKRVS